MSSSQVNNNYVMSKLLLVVYPIPQKSWSRRPIDDAAAVYDETVSKWLLLCLALCTQTSSYSHKWAPPKFDINAPDLYIPLMAFITYVLLVGYVKGTNNAFTPETLIRTIWSCLLLQLVEAAVAKFGIHMMQVSIPFLDLFAYTGYKYVGLCINTIVLSLGKTLYFFCCLYTGGMLAYFVLKTTAGAIPAVSTQGPPRHLMILGFAAMQFVMISLLSWL